MKFAYPPESKPLDGYTIKRGIHRGGFGEVYYGLSDAGKQVALKLLHNNAEVELRGVKQCLNLNHPNLVSIHDIRTDRHNDHWIVMEYVAGKNLDQVVREHPDGLPMPELQHWLSGISEGLAFLHDRGLVHRDLKPANVFEDQGFVKIGDVGLSKFISQSRRGAQTQSVGTVYYMAPEVARGSYGCEVDIYALGIMLYEMLTGRVPFEGETQAEILMKHLSEKPDLSPIPHALRPILAKALDKDPLQRYGDAKSLEAAFHQALGVPRSSKSIATASPSVTPPPVIPHSQIAEAARSSRQSPVEQPTSRQPVFSRNGLSRSATIGLGIGLLLFFSVMGGRIVRPSSGAMLLLGTMGVGAWYFWRRSLSDSATAQRRRPAPAPPVAQMSGDDGSEKSVRAQRPVGRRWSSHNLTPHAVRSISLRARAAGLSGSLATASLMTAAITTGLYFITDFFADAPHVAFFGLSSLWGSWLVLSASKSMEGRSWESYSQRFTMLATGIALGAGVYGLGNLLMVNFDGNQTASSLLQRVGRYPFLDETHQPTLASYMTFFGCLICFRRWWWHADSFRSRRFRFSSTLLTLALAYVLSTIVAFPQSWGVLWATTMSAVVQLSAVWVPIDERRNQMVT
ncbi:MAG: serine/threonine-protein kinase [Planctomycetaceae bacterium]